MLRSSSTRFAAALALSLVVAVGLNAQVKGDSGDGGTTYSTLDTYGLGEIVPGSVSDVTARTRAAMIRMKIVEDRARRLDQGWREVRGKRGNFDVVVRLRSQSSSTTRVEVTARRGPARYDKKLAQQVIDEIKKLR